MTHDLGRALLGVGLILAWHTTLLAQPLLVMEYQFNDAGQTTAGVGELPLSLEFQDQDGNPTDWHSAAGGGVSGLPEDLAFDNTASTGMGSGNSGGRAIAENLPFEFPTFSSVTIAGWYRAQIDTITDYARLWWWTHTHQLFARNSYLRFMAGDTTIVNSDAVYTEIDEWVFFAVTYDGTRDIDNVQFWKGTKTIPAAVVTTRTLAKGPLNLPNAEVSIGNNPAFSTPTQPCDAWLDNFRLFAGPGSDGVLSQEQLEALRLGDLANESVALPSVAVSITPEENRSIFDVNWSSANGWLYELQASPDLQTWTNMPAGPFSGNGGILHHRVESTPDSGTDRMFYRLLLSRESSPAH